MSNPGGSTAVNTVVDPTTPSSFYAFYQNQDVQGSLGAPYRQSMKVEVVDTHSNLTNNPGSGVDDEPGFIIQKLKPNTVYRLTFSIFKEESDGGGGIVYTEVAADLDPAVPSVSSDNSNQQGGTYFWDSAGNNQLYFKTLGSDDSVITANGFGSTRGPDHEPSNDGFLNGFVSNATIIDPVAANGTFDGTGTNSNTMAFDAWIFIFEKPVDATYGDAEFTNQLGTNNFVGYTLGDTSKGVLIVNDVHLVETSGTTIQIPLPSSEFVSPTGTFPVPGTNKLAVDRQYYVAAALYNKDAKYIVKHHGGGVLDGKIKWESLLTPFGGVWSITLGRFRALDGSVLGGIHNSTAISVDIDGLGVVGAITSADVFKIKMTATPI